MRLHIVGSMDGICGVRDLEEVIPSLGKDVDVRRAECAGADDVANLAKDAGSGGAVVLGSMGADCAPILGEFLRSGFDVLVNDVLSCTTAKWTELEGIAIKHGRRLLCSSHVQRFNPDLYAGMSYTGGSVRINMRNSGTDTSAERTLGVPADIAMLLHGSVPQAVFASTESSAEQAQDTGQDNCAIMMRFEGGASALIASSCIRSGDTDPARGTDLDVAVHDKSTSLMHADDAGIDSRCAEIAMLRYLMDGTLPDFAESGRAKRGIAQSSCADISHVMEAVLVSINTGAPVYIQV